MDAQTIALLAIFNILIWSIVVSRLIVLARNVNRIVSVVFAIGMLFQGIHSIILPFGDWYKQFIPGRFVNSIETACSVISSTLLFYTAVLFWEYAIKVDEDEKIYLVSSRLRSKQFIAAMFAGMVLALVLTITFELGIAGEVSNTLTPSSTNINRNIFLLISRIGTMGYIVFAEIMTGIVFLKMLITSYGRRNSIRAVAATASILIHASHFAINLIVTVALYFSLPGSEFQKSTTNIYAIYDSLVLIPLGICFFVAVGPNWLIHWLDDIKSITQLLLYRRRIIWLRNSLVKYFPSVILPLSVKASKWNMLRNIRYETTRHVIECSDAIHLLFRSLEYKEQDAPDQYNEVVGSTGLDSQALYLANVIISLSNNDKGGQKDLSNLPIFKARTLQELTSLYARIATVALNGIRKNKG